MRKFLILSCSFAFFIGCGRRDNPVIHTKDIIGKCATPGYAKDVFVLGNYAYIADGQAGLQVISISDPAHPILIGGYDTGRYAYGVVVRDTIAYIADGQGASGVGGLRILNVSNPDSIIEVGFDAWIYAYDLCVVSRNESVFVFIAAKDKFIIDNVTNPMFPTLVGRCETPGVARGVCTDGNYAYVANEQLGMQVISLSDFSHPEIIGACDTPGKAVDVFVSENYAYVADGRGGLQIIDISEPEEPKIVGSCNTSGYANKVFVFGNYAYIADGDQGLQVINVFMAPRIIGQADTPYANSVYVTPNYVYLSDRDEGLVVIQP